MKSKTKNIIKWIISVFFLLSALVYLPSIASIFMAILGVFFIPIMPIQNLIKKYLKAKWLRLGIAVVLFIISMLLVPSTSGNVDSADSTTPTGSSISDTIESTDDDRTETTAGATNDSTTDATTEATSGTTASTTPSAVTLPQNSSFEAHFIDVGQADAALILCDGKAMLIDGGNVGDSSKLYTYLKNHNISHLDYVIGTHAHEDHIGGIAGALNYASVDTVYCPVTSYTSDAFNNFNKAVQKHNVSITVPSAGTTFNLGSASCKILAVNTSSDTNNSSIVLRIT